MSKDPDFSDCMVFVDESGDLHLVCDGQNALRRPFPFQLVMIPKTSNSAGLQLTDLMARPVALHYLRPEQQNRSFDIIAPKLRRSPTGITDGWGLTILP